MIIWIAILVFGLFIAGYLAHICFCKRKNTEVVHLTSDDLTVSLMHEGEKEPTEPDVPLTALLGEREWKVRPKALSPNSTWTDIIPECRDLPQLKPVVFELQNQQQWASDAVGSSECDDLKFPVTRILEQHEAGNDSEVTPNHYDWREKLTIAEDHHENMLLLYDSGDKVNDSSEPQVQLEWGSETNGSSERNDESIFLALLPEEHEWVNYSDKSITHDWLVNSTYVPNELEKVPFLCGPEDYLNTLSESPCQREQITEVTANGDSNTSLSVLADEQKTLRLPYEATDSVAISSELRQNPPDSTRTPGRHNVKISSTQSPNHKMRENCSSGFTDNVDSIVSPNCPAWEHGNLFIQDSIQGCLTISSETPGSRRWLSDSMSTPANESTNGLAMPVSYQSDSVISTTPIHGWTNKELSTVPVGKQENLLLLDRCKNYQSILSAVPSQRKYVANDTNTVFRGYERANGSHQSTHQWLVPSSFPAENLELDKLFILDGAQDPHVSFESSEQKYIFDSTESPQRHNEIGNIAKLCDQEQPDGLAETLSNCLVLNLSFPGVSAPLMCKDGVFKESIGLSTSPEEP